MPGRYLSESVAERIHVKTVEILAEVGFCVPEAEALARLEAAGFQVDWGAQMVRASPELVWEALRTLPRRMRLYDRAGGTPATFYERPSFMGAGTPVNVLDLETGRRRPATWQDVRALVRLQDALPQVDIVRPTVTATDAGRMLRPGRDRRTAARHRQAGGPPHPLARARGRCL